MLKILFLTFGLFICLSLGNSFNFSFNKATISQKRDILSEKKVLSQSGISFNCNAKYMAGLDHDINGLDKR